MSRGFGQTVRCAASVYARLLLKKKNHVFVVDHDARYCRGARSASPRGRHKPLAYPVTTHTHTHTNASFRIFFACDIIRVYIYKKKTTKKKGGKKTVFKVWRARPKR